MNTRHKLGAWYRAHRKAQDKALRSPMPAATRYKGERYTADPANDWPRYLDMLTASRRKRKEPHNA